MGAKKKSIIAFKYAENESEHFYVVQFDFILTKFSGNAQGFAICQKGITVNVWSQPSKCSYTLEHGRLLINFPDFQIALNINEITNDEAKAKVTFKGIIDSDVFIKHYIE